MKLSKQTYRAMNKAYNTIFDSWQEIDEMPPNLYKQLNTALVLLDGVLDELKEAATEESAASPAEGANSTSGLKDSGTPTFQIFGGK